jgi:hypothetical protein
MKDAYERDQQSDSIEVSELLNADGTVNVSAVRSRQAAGVTPSLCGELRDRIHDEQLMITELATDYEAAASTIKDHIKGNCTCATDVTPVRSTQNGHSYVKADRCGETRANGDACKRITGGDAGWQHDDTDRCGAYTNGLTPCREPATEGDRCWRHADRESVTCPHAECDRTFDSDHALKAHHYQAHGESLIAESECKHCGTSFRPPAKNEGVYCSTECMAADYDTSVTLACEHCGDEFTVQQHMAEERRFCSQECVHASRESKIVCECAYCGDTVHRMPSRESDTTFCSPECHARAQRKRASTTCEHCGDSFEVRPSEVDSRTYCSRQCTLTAQSNPDRPTQECVCGREYEIKSKPTTHCSQHCASEVACDRPRPADHDMLVWVLYHYEGLSETATLRRANVNTDDMLSPADVAALIDDTRAMTLTEFATSDASASPGVAGDD